MLVALEVVNREPVFILPPPFSAYDAEVAVAAYEALTTLSAVDALLAYEDEVTDIVERLITPSKAFPDPVTCKLDPIKSTFEI